MPGETGTELASCSTCKLLLRSPRSSKRRGARQQRDVFGRKRRINKNRRQSFIAPSLRAHLATGWLSARLKEPVSAVPWTRTSVNLALFACCYCCCHCHCHCCCLCHDGRRRPSCVVPADHRLQADFGPKTVFFL